jgi:hypothetical protein
MSDWISPKMKEAILEQTKEEKINMLEDAIEDGFFAFWGIANILLEAPIGEGGGLTTEDITAIWDRKYKKHLDK